MHADASARSARIQIYLLTGQSCLKLYLLPQLIWPYSANYIIARDGNFALDYGTSASTPVVGAIVALINDARLARGKKPVGESQFLE